MINREPLTSRVAMLKGWIAGSLGGTALLVWWLFPLIVLAIIIFLDSVIAIKKVVHIVTTIIFTAIGGLISLSVMLANSLLPYTAIVAVITCLYYTKRWWLR